MRRFGAAYLLIVLALGGLAAGRSDRSEAASERRGAPPPVVDPHKAALDFSLCMRRHGVPYPEPDAKGNFNLQPADEQRLRSVSRRKREAAEKACFHHLRPVVSTKPLSPQARERARKALQGFARCMRGQGFDFYFDPVVRNLTRGRAFFGFNRTDPALKAVERSRRFIRARTSCERKLNARLDEIIAKDRGAWVP